MRTPQMNRVLAGATMIAVLCVTSLVVAQSGVNTVLKPADLEKLFPVMKDLVPCARPAPRLAWIPAHWRCKQVVPPRPRSLLWEGGTERVGREADPGSNRDRRGRPGKRPKRLQRGPWCDQENEPAGALSLIGSDFSSALLPLSEPGA